MAGSGGVIVIDDSTCMVRGALRASRKFYAEESCGQCTPCREGTPWMEGMLEKIEHGHGAAAATSRSSSSIAGQHRRATPSARSATRRRCRSSRS